MAVNKDMFHAQTTPSNQLFNTACKVLDGVSKLKERNAELEKKVEELKYKEIYEKIKKRLIADMINI